MVGAPRNDKSGYRIKEPFQSTFSPTDGLFLKKVFQFSTFASYESGCRMKTSIVILLHTGYWLSYFLLITFLYALPLGTEPLPASVADGFRVTLAGALAPAVGGFYVFYFWLVPGLLARQEIRRFLSRGLFVSAIIGFCFSVLGTLVLSSMPIGYPMTHFKVMQETVAWRQIWLFLGFTFIAAFNGIVSTVLRGFVTWYTDIRVKENLEKEKLQTQLDLLQAQLQPHFLFNTLNNIDTLIQDNAELASRYLNYLSEMLRFMLYQSSQERVPLEKEIDFVNRYISLQKIRTNNDDFVECSLPELGSGLVIAPLLFLPFLENAFKYSANKKIPKAISIRLETKGDELFFFCHNVISGSSPVRDQEGGLGLRLIKKRLELLYKDRHELTIERTETTYRVQLWLKLSS